MPPSAKRVSYEGEKREIDVKSWWDIRRRYHKGDMILVIIKGHQHIKGVYTDLNKSAICVFVDKEGRELYSESIVTKSLDMPADGNLWIPRNQVIDVSRAKIEKSDTPKMKEVKDRQAKSPGEKVHEARYRLDQLLERKGRTTK